MSAPRVTAEPDLATAHASAREDVAAAPRAAGHEFVALHQRDVWRFLRWLGADAALADDLLQETFVKLLQRRAAHGALPGDERALRAWLCTTARNLFRNARARARDGVPLDDDATLLAVFERDIADGDERIASLRECLAELPERSRAALWLHYRDRMDHARTGSVLGLSAAGTKALLRRLRHLLADCIERRMR